MYYNNLYLTCFKVYLIGLAFGMVINFLFRNRNQWKDNGLTYRQSISLGLFIEFIFFVIVFLLCHHTLSYSGSFSTNYIFSLFMFGLAMLASMLCFGVIKLKIASIPTGVLDLSLSRRMWNFTKVLLNKNYILLAIQSVFIGVFIFDSPASIMFVFCGFFTAYIFAHINSRRDSPHPAKT